jgi:DNA-binding IclR family transcriptional regulator
MRSWESVPAREPEGEAATAELGLSEIASRLGIGRSSVYRMLGFAV